MKKRLYTNPNIKIKDLKRAVEEELRVLVSMSICKRAKRTVIEEINGGYRAEFCYLATYATALKNSNPGSRAGNTGCDTMD